MADRLLPVEARRPLWPALAGRLWELDTLSRAAPTYSGPVLTVLVGVRDIAAQNGQPPLPPIDQARLLALRTPSGYLALGLDPQTENGDPQSTYNGVRLGLPLSARLVASVRAKAGSTGWWMDSRAPDPEATFYGLSILHAFGHHEADSPVAAFAGQWMSSAGGLPGAGAPSADMLPRVYFALLLAKQLDVPVPPGLDTWIRGLLNPVAVSGLDLEQSAWLVRVCRVAGIALPNDVQAILATEGAAAHDADIVEILAQATIADATGRADLRRQAASAAAALLLDDGRFRLSARVPVADIIATTIGLSLTGQLLSQGPHALSVFVGPAGAQLYPPGTPGANNAVNLRTTYLALVLAGRISPVSDGAF